MSGKQYLLLLIIILPIFNTNSQQIYTDQVYRNDIKSVLLHRKGWELTHPILNMESDDQLVLDFDVLSDEAPEFYYTIVQCKANWEETDLVQQDYLEGFYENPITNYDYSSNTTVPYIHYSLEFPNEDVQIKLSGNYVIIVYEDFNREKIAFSKKFYVYEPKVNIIANVKRPSSAAFFMTGQQVDVTIDYKGYEIRNPFDEIQLVILQNLDWNVKIDDLKPTYLRSNELVYDYATENVFNGHSEFRYFDIKSLRYQSEYIRGITYDYKYHHVELVPGEERHFGKYFFNDDINGRYLISVQEFPENKIEADYAMVHFTLPMDLPVDNGDVYVYGKLTNWKTNDEAKMAYDFSKRAYKKALLLKQGYYNYCYAVKKHKSENTDIAYIEGSHYETENDYFIFVYHKPFHLRYHKLIGIQVANSIRKNTQ